MGHAVSHETEFHFSTQRLASAADTEYAAPQRLDICLGRKKKLKCTAEPGTWTEGKTEKHLSVPVSLSQV